MTYEEFMKKPAFTHAEMVEIFGGTKEKYIELEKEDEMYSTLIYSGIPVGGADEIGVMNNCMRDFVEKMRSTMGDNMDHERKNNWIMYIIIGALLIAIIGANMLYYVNKTETGKIVNVTKIGNGCSK